jgi:hypothetical protein
MWTFLETPWGQILVWGVILGGLLLAATVVVRKIRSETIQKELTTNELLRKFGELHSQGGLTEAEFRTIKTQLAARLQEEIKDNGEKG